MVNEHVYSLNGSKNRQYVRQTDKQRQTQNNTILHTVNIHKNTHTDVQTKNTQDTLNQSVTSRAAQIPV